MTGKTVNYYFLMYCKKNANAIKLNYWFLNKMVIIIYKRQYITGINGNYKKVGTQKKGTMRSLDIHLIIIHG